MIVAGKEYGTGSSRDWAAKGTNLLGVKAVIAESFERIHRSNLVGMGVLPLQFENGQDRKSLKLTGKEVLNIRGLGGELKPHMPLSVEVTREDGSQDSFKVLCRIDTLNEVEYFKAGGITPLRAAQHALSSGGTRGGWLRPPLSHSGARGRERFAGRTTPRRHPPIPRRTGGWPPRAYPPGPSPAHARRRERHETVTH